MFFLSAVQIFVDEEDTKRSGGRKIASNSRPRRLAAFAYGHRIAVR